MKHKIQLKEKDSLLLYTDGLIEWKGRKGFFRLERFKEYLKTNGIYIDSIQGLLQRSAELHENMDDITYLLIRINDTSTQVVFSDTVSSEKKNVITLAEWFSNIIDSKFEKGKFSSRIKQCFDELSVNAFEHGNKFIPEKSITVNVIINQEVVSISIKDQGNGFDWDMIMKYGCNGSFRGRGILIVKSYADAIKYNQKGNKVNIKFFREGKENVN